MSEEEKGFVIKDRRHFTQEGEVTEQKEETAQTARESGRPQSEPGPEAGGAGQKAECDDTPPLPELNFSTFVFSLSTSALFHLGELPDPNTKQVCRNLPLAKQTIDILVMLKEKTVGNLDEEEDKLLTNLLYELRMKYVAVVNN